MIGSRAWFALMRRNTIYRKRYWLSGIFEIVLPIVAAGILILIKSAFSDDLDAEFKPAVIPNETSYTFAPLTFNDYLTAMQAKRVCYPTPPEYYKNPSFDPFKFSITGQNPGGYNWMVPMVKCDSRLCRENGQDAAATVCEYNIIGIAGDGNRVLSFVSWLEEKYPVLSQREMFPFDHELFQLFDSSDAMTEYVRSADYGKPGFPKLAMGIIFNGNDPNVYDYELRQNSTNFNAPEFEGRPGMATTPKTKRITDDFAKTDEVCVPEGGTAEQGPFQNSCTGQYIYNGILTFQRLVDDFIIDDSGASAASGNFVSEGSVQFVPFPAREYLESGFYAILGDFGPLIISLGFLFPIASMISYIVQEKELRQKELMKMMSVSESDIGWSWFMTYMIFSLIGAVLIAVVTDILYDQTSFPILFFFWILVYTGFVVLCMSIAAMTSKAIRGVLIGILVFFTGAFLPLAVSIEGSAGGIFLLSLHPVAAMTYGLAQIGLLEDMGIGLTSDSISLSSTGSSYNFQQTITSLFASILFWGAVSWYLNRVIKPDYGQAYPFYFPFTSSYWCPSRKSSDESTRNPASPPPDVPYEPVGEALLRQASEGTSIEIHNLRREFGEKKAVDGLSLSMYSGQITALLGHNGAGKTTTIAMLTGAIPPSDGYAVVAGNDIRYQMNAIRQDIGICLQHDCLFPMLTVKEHVQFFSRLKGLYEKVSAQEADEQIDEVIRDVALFEKRNTFSKSLSGGMKRKLSVAMAFSGGSKVVLLDEPTSGMDPFSRRFTWNVIRQYRPGRCIILTTHFMDEADILGDRIAIMASGQLRCAGSSLFLKKHYGVGYQLTIEKTQETHVEAKNASGADDGFKAVMVDNIDGQLSNIVKGAVPAASLLNNTGSEVRYQLPMGEASNFPPMFEGLDDQASKGSIQSYGVSMTTLDEVFLLVAREGHDEEKHVYASSRKHLANGAPVDDDESGGDRMKSERSSSTARMDLKKDNLFFRHLSALTRKRAANFSRDKKAWCCTTLFPTLAVLLGLMAFTFLAPERNMQPLTLTLDDLNKDVKNPPIHPVAYNSPDDPFLCQPGRCAFEPPVIQSNLTNELYGFCGWTSRSLSPGSPTWINSDSCSIAVATEIMTAMGNGTTVQPMQSVTTITNASNALLDTSNVFESSQYGAIMFTSDPSSLINGSVSFNETVFRNCQTTSLFSNYTSPEECSLRYGGLGYVVQYNFTALHTSPLYQALADQAIVREALSNEEFQIKVTIAPLPITQVEEKFGESEDSLNLFILVVLSFPIIAGAFGSFIVVERESKAKHLQTVAGVQPAAYWLSSFLWDTLNYQIPLWITVALFFLFDLELLTTTERGVFSAITTVLFLYGPAAASYTYCLTYAFSSPSVCTMVSIISGFLIGMGGPLAIFIMTLIAADLGNPNPTLADNAQIVRWALSWNPTFLLGRSVFYVLNLETIGFVEGDLELSAWSDAVVLNDVIMLAVQTVVYLILAILLDYWSTNPNMMACWKGVIKVLFCRGCRKPEPDIQYTTPDDTDVVAEEERVLSGGANSDLIVLSQLTKRYDNGKKAVNNLSLGIPHGQCFGLLGINGAGKTSTMAMLTAEFPPSSGDATLAGYSVTREPEKTRRRIGYCPQFDAHFANMTGREHIELYASIKGVPREFVKEAASEKLKEVGLSDFDSDRLCSNYSGGMKRRLSIAIATIGSPQIVFLDECSTGVDPVARREIWELVSNMVSDNSVPREERTSVILTTHSMEECEALCPRIGIMANGKMRCLGSAQHLKDKYGQGFQVELKTFIVSKDDEDYIGILETFARSKGVDAEETDGAFFNLSEVQNVLQSLTSDTFLSDLVARDNDIGYNTWKDASSAQGVSVEALAVFATTELRMRNVDMFLQERFPDNVLRERQDLKARYEVSAKNARISDIFRSIEENKERLWLADYGVSQTSLEQVFNMHAAEAEALKQGRNDR